MSGTVNPVIKQTEGFDFGATEHHNPIKIKTTITTEEINHISFKLITLLNLRKIETIFFFTLAILFSVVAYVVSNNYDPKRYIIPIAAAILISLYLFSAYMNYRRRLSAYINERGEANFYYRFKLRSILIKINEQETKEVAYDDISYILQDKKYVYLIIGKNLDYYCIDKKRCPDHFVNYLKQIQTKAIDLLEIEMKDESPYE